jgi:FixJ family two-component response regulator
MSGPLVQYYEDRCAAPGRWAEGGELQQALIAIVDDDESVREAMSGLMKALGFVAEAFASAEDFLQSGRLHGTSCLIADIQMPGLTGLQLHARIVASGHAIPTILITAHPDDRTRERAQSAGILGYLVKPFSEDALLGCIRSALGPAGAGSPRSDSGGTTG